MSNLKFVGVEVKILCKICQTLASDNPSDTEWRCAERCGLLSMASHTTTMFSGVHTVFTLPPFFFSIEPIASKFLNPVLDDNG